MWGAASILFCSARCSGTLVWARGSRSSRCSPHRVPVPSGGGGCPLGSGGAEGRACGSSAGGGAGGGVGGRPPARSRARVGGGGGSGGGPLVPWRRLLTAGGRGAA